MDPGEKIPTELSHKTPLPDPDNGRYPDPHIFGLTKAAYSVKETLEVLSIGRTSLYDLIGQELLRPIKIGRRTLIGSDDLAALLIKLRRGAKR